MTIKRESAQKKHKQTKPKTKQKQDRNKKQQKQKNSSSTNKINNSRNENLKAKTKTLFRTTQNSTKKRDDKSWSEKSIGKIIKLGGVTVHFSNKVRSKSKDWKAK